MRLELTASERLVVRRARFEEGAELLRLIEGAVEAGCRSHYSAVQRRAVFLTYAENIFVELVQPIDTLVAVSADSLVGLAQVDPSSSRLRGLFVGAAAQGLGIGRTLLAAAERVARSRGLTYLHGAMSLNATPFYAKSGFRPCGGTDHLVRGGVVVPVVPMEKRLLANERGR